MFSRGGTGVATPADGPPLLPALRPCQLTPINPRHPMLRLNLKPQERFRFGRHHDCEQSFPKDFRISSVHATLSLAESDGDAHILIEDSSVNGTFVNGSRVPRNSTRRLATGDEIFLVIPGQQLLAGYTGSLTTNFVGYHFEYADELQPAPDAHVPRPSASEWAPAHSDLEPRTPRRAPGASFDREAEVRQTADAPSWIGRAIGSSPRPRASADTVLSPRCRRPSAEAAGAEPPEREAAGAAAAPDSFVAWWLQQTDPRAAPPVG